MTILLWACAPAPVAPPAGVPADAARIWFSEDAVWVDGARVVDRSEWLAAPTMATDERLVAALPSGRPVWVDAPPAAPFWLVRTAIGSARAAAASAVYLGIGDAAVAVGPGPKLALGGCFDDPVAVRAATPVVTLAVETDGREVWTRGTARFVPVLDGLPTAGLDDCLGAPAPALAPLCATAALGDSAAWRARVSAAARALGLGSDSLLAVVPEARAPMSAVFPVLLGLADAGIGAPGLPTVVLLEGNDGPPTCAEGEAAGVADRAALAAVGDAWVQALTAQRASPDATPALASPSDLAR